MEDMGLDFSKMESESNEIIDLITTPEFNVGETLEEAEELRSRIAELSQKLGEKFDIQRSEIKEAIARLPKTGMELEEDEEGRVEEGQPVIPENIAFVRVTDYMPVKESGKKIVETSYSATKGTKEPIFRLTTHWTVNHVVHNHILGEFEGRKVTIIVPGREMLKENGAPVSMLPVDTFWNKNVEVPKEAVILNYGEEQGDGIINLVEEDNSEDISTLILSAMGYTTVTDHPTYTETEFDLGVSELAKRIGSQALLHTDVRTIETAIESFFHPGLLDNNPSDYLERMVSEWGNIPNQIKIAVVDKIKELSEMKIPFEKKHIYYQAIDQILHDKRFKPELVKDFINTIPDEVLIDFVTNESKYWPTKDYREEVSGMKEYYLDNLSKYLEKERFDIVSVKLDSLK